MADASLVNSTRCTALPPIRKATFFTTETYRGQRIQKFLYKGLAPVTQKDQGVVWRRPPRAQPTVR